jgi:hypothetical protein
VGAEWFDVDTKHGHTEMTKLTVAFLLLGRPILRWEDHIKMDFQEVGCGSMDWMELAQDGDMWRVLVNGVMNLRVP